MSRQTNIEAITDMMEFSSHGALAQAFVIEAIDQYAKAVMDASQEDIDAMRGSFLSPEAWQGVAREIKGKLDEHLGVRQSDEGVGDDAPRPQRMKG